MRLATIQTPAGPRPVVRAGDYYIDLVATAPELPGSVRGILKGGADMLRLVGEIATRRGLPSEGLAAISRGLSGAAPRERGPWRRAPRNNGFHGQG